MQFSEGCKFSMTDVLSRAVNAASGSVESCALVHIDIRLNMNMWSDGIFHASR